MYKRFLNKTFCYFGQKLVEMGRLNNCSAMNGVSSFATGKILDVEMERLVWIDMEMTGLDVDKDKIMEIACLITDSNLTILAESPDIVINQSKEILNNMDEWCTNQHGKTGLTEACLKSQISLEQAENTILNFLETHITPKASPLAGNSVYIDRFFLMKHMPKVHNYLHYRIIDVSTIKELCRRWNMPVYKELPKKDFDHRALNDIRESVAEMKYYQQNFFKLS